MDKPKSSFWGSISHIALTGEGERVLVAVSSHEYLFERGDPGLKAFVVTAGQNKTFAIIEMVNVKDSVYRVLAVFKRADLRLVRPLQEAIGNGDLTYRMVEDEEPAYLFAPDRKHEF